MDDLGVPLFQETSLSIFLHVCVHVFICIYIYVYTHTLVLSVYIICAYLFMLFHLYTGLFVYWFICLYHNYLYVQCFDPVPRIRYCHTPTQRHGHSLQELSETNIAKWYLIVGKTMFCFAILAICILLTIYILYLHSLHISTTNIHKSNCKPTCKPIFCQYTGEPNCRDLWKLWTPLWIKAWVPSV